jgi:alkanesulfonate monooxygenase SsuD/methylene tetrahydromethanopterin reductase-like flavin-dependent oxidoreductase (luciferase family)
MLALVGRLADGWLPSSFYVPPGHLPEMQARIDDAAATAGRDPAAVRRAYNIGGVITDGPTRGVLKGPIDQWIEELTRLALSHGVDTFVLWPEDPSPASCFASPRKSARRWWRPLPGRDGEQHRYGNAGRDCSAGDRNPTSDVQPVAVARP